MVSYAAAAEVKPREVTTLLSLSCATQYVSVPDPSCANFSQWLLRKPHPSLNGVSFLGKGASNG